MSRGAWGLTVVDRRSPAPSREHRRHRERKRLATRRRTCCLLASILEFLAIGLIGFGLSTGPLPGFTRAPGESACTECHDSFGEETNRGPGELRLEHPARYEPGQMVTITVVLEHVGQRRWGFQLTALTTDTLEPAGEFVLADPVHTQIAEGPTGRRYVEHTRAGTFAGQPNRAQWTLIWRAPERDVGPVTFYATGNAADGDGTRLNDWIYSTESTIASPSYPAARLRFPRGGERFRPGQLIILHWEASSNVTSFDLLFFPRPGALPHPIASELPAETRSFPWIVPTITTDAARIAVLAFNEVGFALAESSPFRIVAESAGLPGDVNEDGRLDGEDLRLLLRIVRGQAPPTPKADVNRDGGITTRDVLRLLEALLGLGPL